MDNDPNQPESSSSGEQPPSQYELPQEPPLYESPPHWRQQPLPQYRQPPYGQPQYGYWPPQQPKKRSRRWLWITLAIIGGLVALGCVGSSLFVALSLGSFVRLARPVTNVRQAGLVTNLNDNGPGSLRQIIANARPGSTITFDKNLRGTILLTSGDLNIAQNLTIRGPGAGKLSISGGKSGYIVLVAPGVTVTISGLIFKDSNTSNGFIDNAGTLTLNNSTVSGNTASGTGGAGGGINNGGTLTLNNSTVSGNTTNAGSGIFNNGALTLNNSTVSGNTATDAGGGIFNNDTLTLSNSTVSGNTATDAGGGIFNNGTLTLTNSTVSGNTATNSDGGGIFNNGTLTMNNSTISDNMAANGNGGGIAISDLQNSSSGGVPVPVMLYCTVYGNTAGMGGGIWVGNITQGGVMSMGASIVAGNKAHTDPDVVGSLTTLGYNLVGDHSGATFLGSPKVQSTDVLGVSLTNLLIDPKLRDNGGSAKPHTWTHALLPGSPAIDLIPPEACRMFKVQSDQRGVKRLQGKGCDSGAYQ